jgi:hypothetical protein
MEKLITIVEREPQRDGQQDYPSRSLYPFRVSERLIAIDCRARPGDFVVVEKLA